VARAWVRRWVAVAVVASIAVAPAALGASAASATSPTGGAVRQSAPGATPKPAPPSVACRFTDPRLKEISGLARSIRHPGVLWTHNDSGGGPYLYAIDAATCAVKAVITIQAVPARDIEAIATGRDGAGRAVIWVGDIGDNNASWPFVRLHAVVEPATLRDQSLPARTWRFRYEDGSHDAETLLADPDKPRLWVVTKSIVDAGVYRIPALPPLAEGGTRTDPLIATRVARASGFFTDGSVAPDGRRVVLRGYMAARFYDELPPVTPVRTIRLPSEPQGEAVTWASDGKSLYVAGEKDDALWRVPLTPASAAPSASATPSGSASPAGSATASTGSGLGETARWALAGLLAVGAAGLVALASWRFRVG